MMANLKRKYSILYISTVCSPETFDYIFKSSVIKPSHAAQKFNRLLVEGFATNESECSIDVLSSIPVTTLSQKKKWWALRKDKYKGIVFRYIPFLNFFIFKHFYIFFGVFYQIFRWRIRNNNHDRIVIFNILEKGLVWSSFLACKLTGQKMMVLVTDLPGMLVDSSPKSGLLSRFIVSMSMFVLHRMDFYVILTKQMNEVVNPKEKPYMVMEGLVDSEVELISNRVVDVNQLDKRIFLYAGGIYKKYGVKKMIDAFLLLKEKNIELHIYGSGDLESSMSDYCATDNRIKYFGVVSNDIVVERLKTATLLINPRPTVEEFTKYSFPSKNMEFLVSGTPLLTTRLLGIPSEYYDYCFFFDDESILGMKSTFENLLSKSKLELIAQGIKGQEFVLRNKSNIIQAKRIIDFLTIQSF